MTDVEQYQIIGKLVSDLGDTKKRLAMLQTKADTLSHGLHGMADALTENAKARFDGPVIHLESKRLGGRADTVHWPTVDELRELLIEIDDTKHRLASLEKQRVDLGVPQ
jgi:hypothetical protein